MKAIFLLFPFLVFAIELKELLVKPKSYVRDFYLTEFMRDTNNLSLAYKAYNALYKKKMLHLKILSKFNEFKYIYKCIDPTVKDIKNIDIACILDNGLWLRSIAKLDKNDLKYLYKNLPEGKEKNAVYAFLYNDFSKIFKDRDTGYYFIINYPQKEIDQVVDNFDLFEDKYFYLFVKSIVLNDLPLLRLSLTKLDFRKFDDNVKWWLFLNELKFDNKNKAIKKELRLKYGYLSFSKAGRIKKMFEMYDGSDFVEWLEKNRDKIKNSYKSNKIADFIYDKVLRRE